MPLGQMGTVYMLANLERFLLAFMTSTSLVIMERKKLLLECLHLDIIQSPSIIGTKEPCKSTPQRITAHPFVNIS